jgi:hypothetical protein
LYPVLKPSAALPRDYQFIMTHFVQSQTTVLGLLLYPPPPPPLTLLLVLKYVLGFYWLALIAEKEGILPYQSVCSERMALASTKHGER